MTSERPIVTALPVEVLEHIFSYLNLCDRKSTSLVCHFWNELAFSHRLLRDVTLRIQPWDGYEWTEPDYFRTSTRRYRSLFVTFVVEEMVCVGRDAEVVTEALNRFGADLESFHCITMITEELLRKVITSAPKLQQLIVDMDDRTLNQQQLPELSSLRELQSLSSVLQIQCLKVPNLQILSANFTKKKDASKSVSALRRLAPQLRGLELTSKEYFIPIERLQFPQVVELKLGDKICEAASDCALRSFYTGFKVLKHVSLTYDIKEIELDILTNACPGIEYLYFSIVDVSPNVFGSLYRLKRLKTLSIVGICDFHISSECKPLTSVERFRLQMFICEANDITGFRQLLPNVTVMNVPLKALPRSECILENVCQNFTHLQKLTIANGTATWLRKVTSTHLHALKHLDRLEELTLQCIPTRVTFTPANHHLKCLTINCSDWFSDEDLLVSCAVYPNLRYLEVRFCKLVTYAGIAEFRSRMMDCVVDYMIEPEHELQLCRHR